MISVQICSLSNEHKCLAVDEIKKYTFVIDPHAINTQITLILIQGSPRGFSRGISRDLGRSRGPVKTMKSRSRPNRARANCDIPIPPKLIS